MSDFDFDPTEAEPSRGAFVCVPAGNYLMRLTSAEEEEKSEGVVQRVVSWDIVEGEFANTTLLQFVLTHHTSEMAQKIGRETLSAICAALLPGVAVRNSDQLLGKVALNTVQFVPAGTVEKGKGGKPDFTHTKDANRITAHKPATDATAKPPARRSSPTASAAPPTAARHTPPANTVAPAAVAAVNGAAAVPSWRTARA